MGHAHAVATRTAQHAPAPAVRPHRPEASAPGPAPRRPVHELSRVAAQRALSGPGNLVDAGPRALAEAATGVDLGHVRIHTGPQVRAAGAAAFTLGRDIGVATDPGQEVSAALLRHELVHAAQQSSQAAPPRECSTAPPRRRRRRARPSLRRATRTPPSPSSQHPRPTWRAHRRIGFSRPRTCGTTPPPNS
ncbi:DUF4157 domain-containing protein [Streptosporangium canum]|uniref:eCIS core domain-containing protein n=1 Tax=Streptosporangium canum TaxID=324952 RepID=UPI00339E6777